MRQKDNQKPHVDRTALCHFSFIRWLQLNTSWNQITGQTPILMTQTLSGPDLEVPLIRDTQGVTGDKQAVKGKGRKKIPHISLKSSQFKKTVKRQ